MCKVSVIVPIYNIKQYLPRCIDSIRNQTMEDIEIILIDDGSTDGCSELCDQYSSIDPRIRVLHKENEGLSAARNDGIQMARADYIMFVDGDDWVEPEFCELPYRAAVGNKAEVVCFHYVIVLRNGKRIRITPVGEGLLPKGDVITLKKVGAFAWSNLYLKTLFDAIHYPVGRVYEDLATTHRILHSANGIYLLNQYLYNYCSNRSGSITEIARPEYQKDHLWALSIRFHDFASWGVDASDELLSAALNNIMKYGRKTEWSNNWEEIICQKKGVPSDISWKRKTAFAMYRLSPLLFDIACVLTKRRRV